MQAIRSRFLPLTNTRPARIKAECERGSITLSIHSAELDNLHKDEERHAATVSALIARFDAEDLAKYSTPDAAQWGKSKRVVGQLADGSFVHVFTE